MLQTRQKISYSHKDQMDTVTKSHHGNKIIKSSISRPSYICNCKGKAHCPLAGKDLVNRTPVWGKRDNPNRSKELHLAANHFNTRSHKTKFDHSAKGNQTDDNKCLYPLSDNNIPARNNMENISDVLIPNNQTLLLSFDCGINIISSLPENKPHKTPGHSCMMPICQHIYDVCAVCIWLAPYSIMSPYKP